MKKIKFLKVFMVILIVIIFVSCSDDNNIKYPVYSLKMVKYVPDSLKEKQRTWIIEIVRAASQQMTGGDYEDVGETILQAERTSNRLFQVNTMGLKKEIDDYSLHDLYLTLDELSNRERYILDSLLKK